MAEIFYSAVEIIGYQPRAQSVITHADRAFEYSYLDEKITINEDSAGGWTITTARDSISTADRAAALAFLVTEMQIHSRMFSTNVNQQ